VVASVVRFARHIIGQADGFVMCIALLVAALAVSYTGVCSERQKPAQPSLSQAETVPTGKKKVT